MVFTAEVVLGSGIVVAVLAIGVENGLHIVGAVCIFLEFIHSAQVPDTIDGKARALQLGCRAAGAGGADDLAQFKARLEDRIVGVIVTADDVLCLAAVGKVAVVIDLIAQIPFGEAEVIPVIRLDAGERTTLGHGTVLVFVYIVGVLAAAVGGQWLVLAGGLQGLVQHRVLAGDIVLAVTVQRQDKAGGAFHQIVFAKIQVGKSQHAVFDLGTGDQMIFGENRQVVHIPAAVGQHGGVPDRVAVGVYDFGVVHHTRNAIRVLNVLSCVQVVHGPLDAGSAV